MTEPDLDLLDRLIGDLPPADEAEEEDVANPEPKGQILRAANSINCRSCTPSSEIPY